MPKSQNQKMKLLYLIKIFNEKTDEKHPDINAGSY